MSVFEVESAGRDRVPSTTSCVNEGSVANVSSFDMNGEDKNLSDVMSVNNLPANDAQQAAVFLGL